MIDELTAIFADMGFAVAEGPDIETDDYNFTKLNFLEGHPAREMHDTFYLQPEAGRLAAAVAHAYVAGAGAHHAERRSRRSASSFPAAPIAVDSDQTHTPMFHQVEGCVIDKGAHLGHLKWILAGILQGVLRSRSMSTCDSGRRSFRSPSRRWKSTFSASATRARSASARARTGWRFSAAAWRIRTVLRNCGLDPNEYQGFAWGMGIDRIAMLKYGMPDLRAFFEADVRWLLTHDGFRPLDLPTLGRGVELVSADLLPQPLSLLRRSALTPVVHDPALSVPLPCGGGLGRGWPHMPHALPSPPDNERARNNLRREMTARRDSRCGDTQRPPFISFFFL